jgi:site-specific recombinase XerD
VVNNVPVVDRFLLERFAAAPLRIDRLNAKDVRGFVLRRARAMSPGRTKGLVTAMRSFLRYLFMRGEITRDLASGVPAVSMRQRDQVPRFISADGVRRVLGACDRRSSTGRRDYAVLLLLARLGLRASDVVRMTLDDLDWDAGELSVCGKGVRRDRFPIPVDVGGALTEYLRRDRPRCGSRRVFITSTAPLHGFSGPSTVSTIVKSAIVRSGVSAPTKGAHLLRHSLATDLIRRGASLEEIGDLLRHRSPNTTLLYAKVDLASLRDVARPWPGGAA